MKTRLTVGDPKVSGDLTVGIFIRIIVFVSALVTSFEF